MTITKQECWRLTKIRSTNEVVVRGSKAMTIVFQMSDRVPTFIEQSHLETTEGRINRWRGSVQMLTCNSVDGVLVSHTEDTNTPMLESVPRNTAASVWVAAANAPLQRSGVGRAQGVDGHLQPSAFSSDHATAQARSVPVGPTRHERDAGACSHTAQQGVPALPRNALGQRRHARSVAEDHHDYGSADEQRAGRQSGTSAVSPDSVSACVRMLIILQEEAVSENLKNVLLVMSNAGFLAPPDEKPDGEELWNETWKRINRFLPSFFAELFPEQDKKPRAERASKDEASRETAAAKAEAKVEG